MNALTIVAIPNDNSYAHLASSEKVPHLTILYLDATSDTSQIIEYVKHVVDTSLQRFWLYVDRRGLLGDKDADVLFFSKESAKLITDARYYMLANDAVKQAFDRIEQYPEWTPHLTLGYPQSPAKTTVDPKDDETWVLFDKIGIWYGDYEGLIIDLNPMPIEAVQESMTNVEKILLHYGKMGMKWGTRNKTGAPTSEHHSTDAKTATATRAKAKTTGIKSLSNKEIQAYVLRLNLEKQFHQTTPSGKVIKFMNDLFLGVGKQQASSVIAGSVSAVSGQITGRLKKI
jgi:hypothetical protein